VKAAKFAFLFLLLAFGATVETAWNLRSNFGALGPAGCRLIRGRFNGPSFTFDAEERRAVTAGAPVEVENAFGAVRVVQGAPGEVRVTLRKVVFLPTAERARDFAGRIQLSAELTGSTVRVGTNRASLERESPDVGFETHLELQVPPATRLKVTNEHGRVDVADVAEAEISGSFDGIRIERVAGPAKLTARHGDVSVSTVGGTVQLQSRHGDVAIEDVQALVRVETQHGDVSVARVGGLNAQTAHGELRADTIRGDLEVHADHGRVEASQVSGRSMVQTSFRDVRLLRLEGDARIKAAHAGIEVEDVKGSVVAETTFGDVALTRIGGPVEVRTDHGGLRARGLAQGARARVSGDELVLDGFAGPIDVQAERAGVTLSPSGALVGPVSVTTTHGTIRIDVPTGSRFDLDASVRGGGEIVADIPGLAVSQSDRQRVQGRLGTGGGLVRLLADHGDVRLAAAAAAASTAR
jgi:DUF4097 and DUF4098 domain-containing protein YvlB